LKAGLTKLTRVLIGNVLRPVTVDYPVKSQQVRDVSINQEETRGKHSFDEEKCVGCGACTAVCSSGAITESDVQFERSLKVELGRCIFCGRCRDICPERGLELTPQFELSQTGKGAEDSTKVEHTVQLGKCESCGRATFPTKQIDTVVKRALEKIDLANKITAGKDMAVYVRYCPDCRRSQSYLLNIHPRKSY